jgi:lysophospholipase L1-like esterase
MNIVCFGDSITHAGGLAERDRWPGILQAKLNEWKPGKFAVYNRGIGGHTTAQGFDRFRTDVLPLLPAVVLVQFGFNDSYVPDWSRKPRVGVDEYKANLRELHRTIRAHKGKCVLIVNHTIGRLNLRAGDGRTYNSNLAPYNPAVRATAKALKARTIDLPAMMKKRKVVLKKFLTKDMVHLSAEGNHIYADMVFEALTTILR